MDRLLSLMVDMFCPLELFKRLLGPYCGLALLDPPHEYQIFQICTIGKSVKHFSSNALRTYVPL